MGTLFASVALILVGVGGVHLALTTRTEAQVVDLRVVHRRRSSDDCYVSYRFGGRGGGRPVNRADHAALSEGQTIAVWYDDVRFTSEPERGCWSDQATWTPLFFAGAGAFLFDVAGGLLVQVRRRATS